VTLEELIDALRAARFEQELRTLHALGQREVLSSLKAAIGTVPPAQRREEGRKFNEAQTRVKEAFEARLLELEHEAAGADLKRAIDVTLPGRRFPAGQAHILSQVQDELVAIFAELGFELAEGPQVETDFNNFEALAMPKDHPARDMQDTFYVTDDVVLRTHTSPVQIRTMLARKPPVKIIAPGVVYRRDDDLTHSPMFTQIEGLLVDEQVRFSDLKGVLVHMVSRFFGKELDIRLRPSYFPFVEPGAEIDMQCAFCAGPGSGCRVCKSTGWVEIGGSGMVDPRVFAHVGYDSEKYTGFAFGTGVERMAMLRHGINDIKFYYEGDLRFLRQF
jgi:phenylalanyl-tRNA synthetase alpha chain